MVTSNNSNAFPILRIVFVFSAHVLHFSREKAHTASLSSIRAQVGSAIAAAATHGTEAASGSNDSQYFKTIQAL